MKLQRSGRIVALLAASSLILAGCASDDDQDDAAAPAPGGDTESSAPASDLTGTLAGAGASSQTAAVEGWIAGFQSANEGVTVNYDSVGSGAGRDQFFAGDALGFAGSDAALDDEELALATERCGEGGALELPLYISPIAVAYNLPGVDELNLTPENIANIFNQQITNWNDPALAENNEGLPDLAITPVNRSDESGTTENFTEYLVATAADAWPYEASGDWPVAGGEAGDGTSGVVQAITAAEGAIGYADASQVSELGSASVQVGEEFVPFSPEAAAAVVENSPRVEGRPEGSLALELARDTVESGNYPIVLVSYSIACTTYDDAAQGELVSAFLTYVASEEGQAAAAEAAGSAPISETLRADVMTAIELIS